MVEYSDVYIVIKKMTFHQMMTFQNFIFKHQGQQPALETKLGSKIGKRITPFAVLTYS